MGEGKGKNSFKQRGRQTISDSYIQRKTDTVCFHSYVDPEKLNRRPWGRGRGKKVTEREEDKP